MDLFFEKGVQVVRKALLATLAILAIAATPALAGPAINLPSNTFLDFNGDGSFQQFPTGTFDPITGLPNPPDPGDQVAAIANIHTIAPVGDEGNPVWLPADVGPNFEMTESFWGATVDTTSTFYDGVRYYYINVIYTDTGHLALVSDVTKDYSNAADPGTFDNATGDYATVYTLPAGGAPVDAGESLYLSLDLSDMSSSLKFDTLKGKFVNGEFHADTVKVTGGYGAAQFYSSLGDADALIIHFSATGWTFGGDTDLRLHTVPEPATWISLCTGLALLGTYGLRKRM